MNRDRAGQAQAEADDALAGVQDIEVAAAPDEAWMATDKPTEFCPATIPCVGRPAFVLVVPVRVVTAGAGPHAVGSKVGDVEAVYCPQCRAMASRTRQAA